MTHYLNVFSMIFTRISVLPFFLGSWLRYDYGQYTAGLIEPDA